jgi:hypothetical protein
MLNASLTNKGAGMMNKEQQKELLHYLNIYKGDLITNMTDEKVYNDPWKQSDINRLNKHLRLIKKLIKGAN